MPAESVAVASELTEWKRRNHRKARKPFDGRYVIGKRVKQLTAVFRERLGADAHDPITDAAIRRCAETVALSEDLRARMLRGEDVSPDDVLRTTRAADALTRRLHLDRHKRPEGPSLDDLMGTREGAPDERAL
jgi:hypothetical protein